MFGLLAALTIEVILLLWHMEIIVMPGTRHIDELLPAGLVTSAENDLRRRSLNSLIWEKSVSHEPVFYHDSMLTLAQSQATLKLDNGAEIELSENTLVTIEPPPEQSPGEIRLRFRRGGLTSRNPFAASKIEGEDFSLSVKAGSDVELHQVDGENYEVRLKKGEAVATTSAGATEIRPNDVLRISKESSRRLSLNDSLKFQQKVWNRIYTHDKAVLKNMVWSGAAKQLIWQRPRAEEEAIDVAGVSEKNLAIPLGMNIFYLKDQNQVSESIRIEVWPAPVLHLLMPLPRNRLHTQLPQIFMWTILQDIQGYRFKISGERGTKEIETQNNSVLMTFDEEDDALWSVWAKDKNGVEIPPLYDYPVFIREAPLEAPRLRSPKLREPASDKGASFDFWDWVLPKAYGENEFFEAVFSWEAVKGAKRYILEISATPDFRKPLVAKELPGTDYTWKNIRRGKYYWRVAGGSSRRLGLFSEPAEILIDIATVKQQAAGVQVKISESNFQASQAAAPQNSISKEAKTNPSDATNESTSPSSSRRYLFLIRTGYGVMEATTISSVKANLSGYKPVSIEMQTDLSTNPGTEWMLGLSYMQNKFKPTSASEYPFQNELTMQQGRARITRRKDEKHSGFGMSAVWAPKVKRKADEAIELEHRTVLAPHFGLSYGDRLIYNLEMGPAIGSSSYGALLDQRIIYKVSEDWRLGFETETLYLLEGSYHTLLFDGYLLLGYEF